MQKIPKLEANDLEEHELILARCLIQYYRHAFDVRSQGIMLIPIDPPEVRELTNMLLWLGSGFGIIQAGNHVLGLQEVVSSSADEIKALIDYAREHGVNVHLAKEINFIQEQMEAADTLMGYLTDG